MLVAVAEEGPKKLNKQNRHPRYCAIVIRLLIQFSGLLLLMLGILFPTTLVLNLIASSLSDKFLKDTLGKEGANYLSLGLAPGMNTT